MGNGGWSWSISNTLICEVIKDTDIRCMEFKYLNNFKQDHKIDHEF